MDEPLDLMVIDEDDNGDEVKPPEKPQAFSRQLSLPFKMSSKLGQKKELGSLLPKKRLL